MKKIYKAELENALYQHNRLKYSHFWKPAKTIVKREANSFYWQQIHPSFQGTYRGHEVQVLAIYKEYAKYIKYSMKVIIDNRKSSIRVIKKLLKDITEKQQAGVKNVSKRNKNKRQG